MTAALRLYDLAQQLVVQRERASAVCGGRSPAVRGWSSLDGPRWFARGFRGLLAVGRPFGLRTVTVRAGLSRRWFARQRWKLARLLHVDADPVRDPRAVVLVGIQEVPDHSQLDVPVALLERVDEVVDQVVALAVVDRTVALADLRVVVLRAPDLVAADLPFGVLTVLDHVLGRLDRRARLDARLEVHVRVVPAVDAVRHDAVALVRRHFDARRVRLQLKVVGAD